MKVTLYPAPWHEATAGEALAEACTLLADDVWRDAAIDFYAKRAARLRHGRNAPKGMQTELNRVITSRFEEAGWIAVGGRFVKEDTWVRVTFRHQMSLGSDLLDAIRVHVKERYEQVAILAAESDFLRLVSPSDVNSLVSFEKLRIAVADLNGVVSTPLYFGGLTAMSVVPPDILSELSEARFRGVRHRDGSQLRLVE